MLENNRQTIALDTVDCQPFLAEFEYLNTWNKDQQVLYKKVIT